MKAVWNDHIIADSNSTIKVEGNPYFPADSVKKELLKESDTQYTCPWKGEATYYHLEVNGEKQKDAAWAYHNPKEAAANIAGHIAFEKAVDVGK